MSAPSKTPRVDQDEDTYSDGDAENSQSSDPVPVEQLAPSQQTMTESATYDESEGRDQSQHGDMIDRDEAADAMSAQSPSAAIDNPDAPRKLTKLEAYWQRRDPSCYNHTVATGGTLLETNTDIKLWGAESTPHVPGHEHAEGVAPTHDPWAVAPPAHDGFTGFSPDPLIMPLETTTTKSKKKKVKKGKQGKKKSITDTLQSDQHVELPIPGLCIYQDSTTGAWSQPCADPSLTLHGHMPQSLQTETQNDHQGRTADLAFSIWTDQPTSFQDPGNGRWERLSSDHAKGLVTMSGSDSGLLQPGARIKKSKKVKRRVGQTTPASALQQPDPRESTEDFRFDAVNSGTTGPYLPGSVGDNGSADLSSFAHPPVSGYPGVVIDRGTSPVNGGLGVPSEVSVRPLDPDESSANQGAVSESLRAVGRDLYRYPDWWCSDDAALVLFGQEYVDARRSQRSLGRMGVSFEASGKQRANMITKNMVERLSETGRDCIRASAAAPGSFASYVRSRIAGTSSESTDADSHYSRTPNLAKMPASLEADIAARVGRSTNGSSLLADTIANCDLLSNVASFTFRNPHLRAQNLTRLHCLHLQIGSARPPTLAQWQAMDRGLSREVGTEVAVALRANSVGYSKKDREQVVQSALSMVLDSARTCCNTGDHHHIRMPAALRSPSGQGSAATLVKGTAVSLVVTPSDFDPEYNVKNSPW